MSGSPFVILYVEDDVFVRQSFAELLTTAERRVIDVAGVADARQTLLEQSVSLLITDVNLSDGSGLDVAREALQQNPRLPVIVCSGDDLRGVAQSLGSAARVLRKPVDFDELEALVEQLARSAQ